MSITKAASRLIEQFRKNSYVLGTSASPAPVIQPTLNQPEIYPRTKPVSPGLSFEINRVVIEPAHLGCIDEIERFLFMYYFRQQPIFYNLGIENDSKYLANLAKKYSTSGDRWLAYEMEPKMRKRRLIGALVAYKKFPWEAGRLEHTAAMTPKPESYHLYFCAHCIRAADVFSKYRIPYVYDIELVSVARDVAGLGVESLLLKTACNNAFESEHYPLIQVISTNNFLNTASVQAGMTLEWSMKLAEFADENNESLLYSNIPEDESATVNLYVRLFFPKKDTVLYHPKRLVKQNPVFP